MLRAMDHYAIENLNEARLKPQFRQEVEIDIRFNTAFKSSAHVHRYRFICAPESSRPSVRFELCDEKPRSKHSS